MDKLKNKILEKRAMQEDGITTFLSNRNNIANTYKEPYYKQEEQRLRWLTSICKSGKMGQILPLCVHQSYANHFVHVLFDAWNNRTMSKLVWPEIKTKPFWVCFQQTCDLETVMVIKSGMNW